MSDQPNELDLLRDLAERAMGLRAMPATPGQTNRAQLLPAALPAQLPVDLPVPPGSRLIGSVVRPRPNFNRPMVAGELIEIVYDTTEPADAILSFYETEMATRGWLTREPPGPPRPGGFVPAMFAAPRRLFCQSERGPALNLMVREQTNEPTEIHLSFDPEVTGPCAMTSSGKYGHPMGERLPGLRAPADVALSSQGGGGGSGSWHSDARAYTALSPAELAAQFEPQLVAAGWTRRDGRVDGPFAWSTWSLPDEGWLGLLYVLQEPVPNRLFLRLQVELEDQSGAGGDPGGWSGWNGGTATTVIGRRS